MNQVTANMLFFHVSELRLVAKALQGLANLQSADHRFDSVLPVDTRSLEEYMSLLREGVKRKMENKSQEAIPQLGRLRNPITREPAAGR